MKNTNIKSLKEGSVVKGFFLCKRFNIKISRLGDPFIDLLLEDSTGTIRAKIWSFVDEYKKQLKHNNPYAIKGKVVSFNQALEIDVYNLTIVKNSLYDKYGYSKDLLINKLGVNIDFLYGHLIKKINQINHNCKKDILSLLKENKQKILLLPSTDKKYNSSGGFLSQIVSLLNLNNKIYSDYKYDFNIVSIGLILKNIGLINYYSNDFYNISDKDKERGYNLLTLEIVNKKFKNYNDVCLLIQNLLMDNKQIKNKEIEVIKYLYKFDLLVSS